MVGIISKEGKIPMDNKNIGKRNNTMTQKLINELDINEIERIWIKYGMYKGAEELSKIMNEWVSFSTLRYMSQKYNWKRPINKRSPMYLGYLAGNVDPSNFKHLIFPGGNE